MKATIAASLATMAAVMAAGASAQVPVTPASEIVVIGQSHAPIEKIDRQTYDIKDDPEASGGIITDILRKLPSVMVSADSQVALRGASVTILIDGKAPPEGNAVIKSLPSSDVERIEIMTHPSAQYTPDGAGGIINIITRKRRALKISGDLSSQVNTRGQGNASLSATLVTGRWTLGGQLFIDHYQDRNTLYFHQATYGLTDGFEVSDREDRTQSTADNASSGLSAAYRLSDTATLTFKGEYSNYDSLTKGVSVYHGIDNFDELSWVKTGNQRSDFQALYEFVGNSNGEYLALTAERSQYANRSISDYDQGDGHTYGAWFDNSGATNRLQGDYERRFGRNRLSAGVSVEWTTSRVTSVQDRGALHIGLADYDHLFAGAQALATAYATWQMPMGKWIVQPGMRAERLELELTDEGRSADFDWYPSLHVSRDLTDKARLKLNYSKRVFRPALSDYDPSIRYYGGRNAFSGNPDLEPQTTDSYETAYSYADKDFGLDATLYYRDTRDNFSPYSELTATGLLLQTTINSGHSRSGGVELNLRGPLTKRLSYSLNGNAFRAEVPFIDGGSRDQFGWSGNVLLDYDADNGDRFQLNATAFSQSLTWQGYTRGFYRLDASYRHGLTDKLSLVVSATDILNSSEFSTVVDTAQLKTVASGRPNLRAIKIALAYTFGDAR
ncbi:TonB-dependent receptor plug domain-containing protein [Asticcacaulis sp.]|uniref:TonB-dependent receptor plug domain-containing protein n=1 Tax=Asticcacaulis sp. TaxID=1872648 RepID=UPI002BF9540F|nr:TonB-dependent receptor [Asticcacaulis sp.]HTM79471.1 TonB-dependent receptor [Asticcacaulis sp.]